MASGLKDSGNPSSAASFAQQSRTARAGQFDGGKPPSGPKAEPCRINGVPKLPAKNVK